MAGSAFPFRRLNALGGLCRDAGLPLRRVGRVIKRELALLAFRIRSRTAGATKPPRIAFRVAPVDAAPALPHPAISIVVPEGGSPSAVERFLAAQTESSVSVDPGAGGRAPFCFTADGDLEALPATLLESLLMVAVGQDLSWATAGWALPGPDAASPASTIQRPAGVAEASLSLIRLPGSGPAEAHPVLGRTLAHITQDESKLAGAEAVFPGTTASGPYLLAPATRPATVIRHRLERLDEMLGALPPHPGPPTVLFLLPFLAVGGAEALLFDLLAGLGPEVRTLVVTTEPHQATLGQTVDRCRRLTPHVYTLGDWMPREAIAGALHHLLRRWQVKCLMSWNGTTFFYDHVAELGRRHPDLRILNQLFNHEGGWIEHYSPRVVGSIDLHVAVNRAIASAFENRHGVESRHIATIHHAVEIPPEPAAEQAADRRRTLRSQLGLPEDAVVVGSFIRLHPQKRPLDIIRLARRMQGRPVHFLLVGGGPLDQAVERELAADSPGNLTRVPMQRDARPFYDAVDLCLLTSDYEGLPVFLLDGLARRIPCVATAVGEIPELLGDGGGSIVDRPGDLPALEQAILDLVDPETRRREGERGRKTVESRFGLEGYVEAYRRALLP